tara:strand:+ start:227 stop:493 length:267 start_codon:yes stop_codon:yes gene_type:complete
MASMFSPPKYTPPPAMGDANAAVDQRNARAEAQENKELRKTAAQSRARRMGGRMLYSQDREIPALGTGVNVNPTQSYMRNPYETSRRS